MSNFISGSLWSGVLLAALLLGRSNVFEGLDDVLDDRYNNRGDHHKPQPEQQKGVIFQELPHGRWLLIVVTLGRVPDKQMVKHHANQVAGCEDEFDAAPHELEMTLPRGVRDWSMQLVDEDAHQKRCKQTVDEDGVQAEVQDEPRADGLGLLLRELLDTVGKFLEAVSMPHGLLKLVEKVVDIAASAL